jgi:hypothetical protein
MPWFQLCGAPPGHPVQDKMRLLKEQKGKREDAENILPCLADLFAPWS